MKKKSNTYATVRQWELLKHLPSKGSGVTASELTDILKIQGYSVSKRTVERDLLELSRQFALICNDKSKPYGWKWMENIEFDIPALSLADCVSLSLIEDMIVPMLPSSILKSLRPRFEHARTKINTFHESNIITRWPDKIRIRHPAIPLIPPTIDEAVLDTMHQALLEEKTVQITYQGTGTKQTITLLLHPLGLVQRGVISYIVSTAFDYQDIRLYAMHRITQAEIQEHEVRRPEGFSLDNYVESGSIEFGSGDTIKFKARLHPDVAFYLKESPLSMDMTYEETGTWPIINASVQDSWQFRWWVQSQGSRLEVLEPYSLRHEIAEEALKTVALYR